jgi:hypothetical protein
MGESLLMGRHTLAHCSHSNSKDVGMVEIQKIAGEQMSWAAECYKNIDHTHKSVLRESL